MEQSQMCQLSRSESAILQSPGSPGPCPAADVVCSFCPLAAVNVAKAWRRPYLVEPGQVDRAGEFWCTLNGRRRSGLSNTPLIYRFGKKNMLPLDQCGKHKKEKLTEVDFPDPWEVRLSGRRTWREVECFMFLFTAVKAIAT